MNQISHLIFQNTIHYFVPNYKMHLYIFCFPIKLGAQHQMPSIYTNTMVTFDLTTTYLPKSGVLFPSTAYYLQ